MLTSSSVQSEKAQQIVHVLITLRELEARCTMPRSNLDATTLESEPVHFVVSNIYSTIMSPRGHEPNNVSLRFVSF